MQILRGLASNKPSLHDGELFLEKDSSTLVIQNGVTEIRLAKSTDITGLQGQVTSINETLATMATTLGQKANTSDVNTALASKLTTPSGSAGQFLGFTSANVVGAVDAPGGGSSKFTGTLSTTWSGSAGAYTQQISVSGITANDIPVVFPQITTTNQQTAWNTIQSKVESGAGWIKFYSTAKTSTAVPFVCLWGI